jgi:hypothetical protein
LYVHSVLLKWATDASHREGIMKTLHRHDLFGWSQFDEDRNVDFNGTVWVRADGNVVIDPMPMSAHDQAHLDSLGGAAWVVVTNSDHIRAAQEIAARTGAQIAGPVGEQHQWPFTCDVWLGDGDVLVEGMVAYTIDGSKTPGELCLLIEDHTLVTGDLIRAHKGGSLMMLPPAKLTDEAAAKRSVARLAAMGADAVIVGDGWPLFSGGQAALQALSG